MNILDVRVFLAIARTRNITRTAEHLFISQSHVSKSLHRLENTVGFALFDRGRGKRGIELTAMGRRFLPLAERYLALYSELETLKESCHHTLRIALLESVYYEYLRDFLKGFEKRHPYIRLSIQIKDSAEVYTIVENETADYGFAAYLANYDMLDIRPLYQQEWCIVRYADIDRTTQNIKLGELDPDKEISFLCGDFDNLDRWRTVFLERHQPGGIEVNGMMSALGFLQEPGRWALTTKQYAAVMCKTEPLQILIPEESPPQRTIYCIFSHAKNKRDIDLLFEKELNSFIAAYEPSAAKPPDQV